MSLTPRVFVGKGEAFGLVGRSLCGSAHDFAA